MKLRKITAFITSAFVAITAFAASASANTSFSRSESSVVKKDDTVKTAISLCEDIEFAGSFAQKLSRSIKYNSESGRGLFNGGSYILNTDDLTTDDAIDLYPFTISGTKTVIFRLATDNPDYAAILCPLDTTTNNITLSGPYVMGGDINAVADFNSDGQNTYCAVILNTGSTYGNSYTFAMNAQSKGGAIDHVSSTGDLSRNVFQYSNGYEMNGMSIGDVVDNYLDAKFADANITRMFTREYSVYHSGGIYNLCNVYVSSHRYDLDENNMSLVNYTSNYNSSDAAVLIPVSGDSYHCNRSTNLASNHDDGVPDGNLVYDILSNEIIDWDSDLNYFYISLYYSEQRSYTILSSNI